MAGTPETHNWTRWLHWDGAGHLSTKPLLESTGDDGNCGTPSETCDIQRVFPASPASSGNEHPALHRSAPDAAGHSGKQVCSPITPDHTSNSPEGSQFPELQLRGEAFKNACSSESSRLYLKRKFSEGPESAIKVKVTASQRRPHNVIEKRYRANLNDRIAELKESVPSLRDTSERIGDGQVVNGVENPPAPAKLNKAGILTKAVEYIRQLELRNRRLDSENLSLKNRLIKLECLASQETGPEKRAAAFTCHNTIEEAAGDAGNELDRGNRTMKNPPNGLIPVPESMMKLRQNQPQEHYGAVYDAQPEGNTSSRRWPTKLMLGSLAGIMILDGFGERQEGSQSKDRGLFGIPLEFLDGWWFLRSPRAFMAAFVQYCHTGGVLPLVKGFSALTLLAFIVFMYLFNSKPIEIEQTEKPSQLRTVPSLASPIAVRRQAWLTSMQALKLPHHTFFPEWFAVTVEWLMYSVRSIIGLPAYYWVSGRSVDDEMARVKAWDIAIDAQLAGGDMEISRSRLVLSIFASGTLPQTPTRLMLKALHCRVVLWKVGQDHSIVSTASNRVAAFLAGRQWKKAQSLAGNLKENDRLALPVHLASLLRYDCRDVFFEAVMERAYNLMYDRSCSGESGGNSSLMDDVVEDNAVRSPLDAIAAWWSGQRLYEALLVSTVDGGSSHPLFASSVESAIEIAPPLSVAYTRALAIKAVFFSENRAMNVDRVLTALPNVELPGSAANLPHHAPFFIDSSIPLSARGEISKVVTCGTIMNELHDSRKTSGFGSVKRTVADLFADMDLGPSTMTMLSFAASFHVLLDLLNEDDDDTAYGDQPNFWKRISDLSTWVHSESGKLAKVSPGAVAKLDRLSNRHHIGGQVDLGGSNRRRKSDASHDTGYGSLAEADDVEGTGRLLPCNVVYLPT